MATIAAPSLAHTDRRLETAARLLGYANAKRYWSRGTFLFQGVSLQNASVLDVGCGTGTWAIWTAMNGANSVGIEPEADGGKQGTLESFRRNIKTLELEGRVEAYSSTLQDFSSPHRKFDVVVMYNVINHLDEDAVKALHKNERMAARYVDLLKGLRTRVRTGGTVVVADCARSNLWPDLGLRCPFAPWIEWEKHQDPAQWIRVFERAGFKVASRRWSPYYGIRTLSANSVFHYLTCSHFTLQFTAI
jgi:SAM-dependent methyltransferase